MKKRFRYLIPVLCILFPCFLAGCATTVRMSTLVPAAVNIGGLDTVIAIASPAPYSASSRYSYTNGAAYYSDYVASYAGDIVEKALGQGVWRTIGVKNTDSIVSASRTLFANPTDNLLRAGATVYVQSSVDNMDCYDIYDETWRYVTNPKTKKRERVRYVTVETYATLTMSFTVWDLRTQRILDSFTLSDDTRSSTGDAYRYIDEYRYVDKYPFYSSANPRMLFENILDSFVRKIRNRLVPHYETVGIDLLKDPSSKKNKDMESAYKMAENGDINGAYAMFYADWERTGNSASGVNAAILLYASGRLEEGLNLAMSVYNQTGLPDAYKTYLDLQGLYADEEAAKAQISSRDISPGQSISYW